ncbi:MAG: radical SAM protein, partial [Thermoplasmataceae archaeon]
MASSFISIKGGVVTIGSVGSDVFAFDLEARPLFASIGGKTYRRGLMNTYLHVGNQGGRHFARRISQEEAEPLIPMIRDRAFELLEKAHPDVDSNINYFMSRLSRLNWASLKENSQRLMSIYGGRISIIPPDVYFPLYVRYSYGCTWNRCTFCSLYSGIRHRELSEAEVEKQLSGVMRILGKGTESRRSIFLGDGNAANTSIENLEPVMRKIRDILPLPVDSFMDIFTTSPSREEFLLLHDLGLRRIYIGLESASTDVLRILNKPLQLKEAADIITAAKNSGLAVGLIILSGAGGAKLAKVHIEKTSEYVAHLPLGHNDIVFISPLELSPGDRYSRIAQIEGLEDLPNEQKIMQAEILKKEIASRWSSLHGTKIEFP